ncbi:MAG: 23S rRNA (adenine1618-N6)-methyltransferase [Planctomycetota bacterium]|jgi:23S rRNA (adenine1618-N6)-methyltransferase
MQKREKKKVTIHKRNKHVGNYNFAELIEILPKLGKFVKLNKYKNESIDFFDPIAVKMLNKALLKKHYGIENWNIPPDFLCPPIPGRADYIHHAADLLASRNTKEIHTGEKLIPHGEKINVLDIGVGSNCIYPIIGTTEYGWSFVGSDSNTKSLKSAMQIVSENKQLKNVIKLRPQANPKHIFKGVIKEGELFDLTVCNPPFHSSKEEASEGTMRKLNNLKNSTDNKLVLNFGGQNSELWCEGGEARFVKNMIIQSKAFGGQVCWFSTLVSKESRLKTVYQMLKKADVFEMKTIKMAQGNKQSRIVAWTFLDKDQQKVWADARWG